MGSRGDKGKSVSSSGGGDGSNAEVEQLVKGFSETKLGGGPSQDGGGEWEVISKRNKNKPGNGGGKSWAATPNQNPPRAWGGQQQQQQQGRGGNNGYGRGNAKTWGTQVSAGRGAGRGQAVNRGYGGNNPTPVTRPPLEGGWNWQSRPGAAQQAVAEEEVPEADDVSEGEEDDCDGLDDSDEDLASDDYDSDVSQQSHGTRKQNKWFKKFFDSLDSLSIEQINEPQRQWHCPACQNGPGAIDWYNLQPLLAHARTKGARRVKLHRELAEVLDKDLQMRGASVIPCGEIYGQWKGLGEEEKDHEIVWPPMVVIMNTRLDKDENDKVNFFSCLFTCL